MLVAEPDKVRRHTPEKPKWLGLNARVFVTRTSGHRWRLVGESTKLHETSKSVPGRRPPKGDPVKVPFTVADFLNRAVAVYGDRVGVVDEPGVVGSLGALTYAEMG